MFGSSQRNVQSENMYDNSCVQIRDERNHVYRIWDLRDVTSGVMFRLILKNKQEQFVYSGDVIIEVYKKNNKSRTSYKTINKVSLDKLSNGICPNNVFKQINDFVKKYFSTRTNSGDIYTHYLCSALCVLSTANNNVSITPISEGNTVGVLVGNTAFCSAQYN